MPLPQNLVTNEVKNAAGVEREFSFRDNSLPRCMEWMASNEAPYLPERIRIIHSDIGKPGLTLVRRSNIRCIKRVLAYDGSTLVDIIDSRTLTIPIGALANYDSVKEVAAWQNSLCSTTGAGSTVLFDGSGTAMAALINGTN